MSGLRTVLARVALTPRGALWLFGKALNVLSWAFFATGVAGAIGTGAGWLPPFNGAWWAKITTILLWLLFACEGYDRLSDAGDEAESGSGRIPSERHGTTRRREQ